MPQYTPFLGDETMNNEDLQRETIEQLENVVDRWCPETCKHEPFKSRMIRALLQLNAYMLDYDRVKRGEKPVGPSFPIDLPQPGEECDFDCEKFGLPKDSAPDHCNECIHTPPF